MCHSLFKSKYSIHHFKIANLKKSHTKLLKVNIFQSEILYNERLRQTMLKNNIYEWDLRKPVIYLYILYISVKTGNCSH